MALFDDQGDWIRRRQDGEPLFVPGHDDYVSIHVAPDDPATSLADTGGEEAVINAIVNAPKLLQRPIVVGDQEAIIGRPPENVLKMC